MWRTPIFGHISSPSSESRILSIDNAGHTLVADADVVTGGVVLKRMPTLRHDKGFDPILISIAPSDGEGEDLIYVMARTPFHLQLDGHGSSCFDVLRHGESMALGCQWQALPAPPVVEELWYGTTSERVHIRSHAVVDGGRTICVSFDGGVGTYCFDTVQLAWSKVGDWVLPFKGGAEVVVQDSDVNLLVGFFAENPNHMCLTPEISGKPAMEEEPQPPELRHIWRQGFVAPENWVPLKFRLINLGCGRFCIARLFIARNSPWESDCCYSYPDDEWYVAVLMGIEVCRGSQGPEVLMHKTWLHQSVRDTIRWVL